MTFQGMDTEQVLEESQALERAAARLEDLLGGVDASVQSVAWTGPDADAFREQWAGTRGRADAIVVPGLGDRSRELQQHVQEQEIASAPEGGDWFDDVLDWLGGLGEGVVDAVGDAVDWLGDGMDWLGDRIGDGIGWLGDRVRDGADFIGSAIDAVRDLEWPRVLEVIAGAGIGTLRGVDALVEFFTGHDLKLMEDGRGYADAPVPVRGEDSGLLPPSDLAHIISNTNETYGEKQSGEVSMTVVGEPPTGVIVNIPGTELWGPSAGDNPMDLTGNAYQASAQGWSAGSEAAADAIAQLYAQEGIPPGTPLMLNGHSQGGMIAASLASTPEFASQFNVTNVMTYGSPVDNYDVPAGVEQLNIQHRGDVVPRVDVGGAFGGPGNGTVVTLDNPGFPLDLGANHSSAQYQNSVAEALQDPSSQLSQYSQDPSLQPFLTSDPDSVQHYSSGVHREN